MYVYTMGTISPRECLLGVGDIECPIPMAAGTFEVQSLKPIATTAVKSKAPHACDCEYFVKL